MRKFDEKNFKVGQVVKVKVTNTYSALIPTFTTYTCNYKFASGEKKTSIEYLLGIIFEDPEDGELIISYFADSKDDVNYEKRTGYDNASDLSTSRNDETIYEILEVLEVDNWLIGSFGAEEYMRERKAEYLNQYYKVVYPTVEDKTHTIVIDDKEIEISEESYNQLKESLNEN